MSATNRLRAILNERGVEYDVDDTQVDDNGTMYRVTYVKEGYGRTWVYEEPPDCDLLVSYNHDLGAEDAIAATLGSGTCKQEEHGWSTEGDHARVWLTCGHDCMVETVADLPNFCPQCGAKVVDE